MKEAASRSVPRWQRFRAVFGSRDLSCAAGSADVLNSRVGSRNFVGAEPFDAAQHAEIVVLTALYAGHASKAENVRSAFISNVLIDVTVPLEPPKLSIVQLPLYGSCTKALQETLEPEVRAASAFQNVSPQPLMDPTKPVDGDVLGCADDPDVTTSARTLIEEMGSVAIDAGPLANSVVAEALTSALIHRKKLYELPALGIRIADLR